MAAKSDGPRLTASVCVIRGPENDVFRVVRVVRGLENDVFRVTAALFERQWRLRQDRDTQPARAVGRKQRLAADAAD